MYFRYVLMRSESMNSDEYALLVDGELEAVVIADNAKDACNGALQENRASSVTLAWYGEGGYEEISVSEYERLGL